MKSGAKVVISLLVILVLAFAVAPARAQQPAPRSYTFYDVAGFLIDCVDFTNAGTAKFYINGRKGNFEAIDASQVTGTPGDSFFWGQVRNVDLAGLFSTRTQFQGACETQGSPFYIFALPSNAACAMVSYNRYDFGRINESWEAVQMPGSCHAWWGGARPAAKKATIKGRVQK